MKVGPTPNDQRRSAIAVQLDAACDRLTRRARRERFVKKYLTRSGIALLIVHALLHEIPMLWLGGAAFLTWLVTPR